jgi:hypothetical protein
MIESSIVMGTLIREIGFKRKFNMIPRYLPDILISFTSLNQLEYSPENISIMPNFFTR